MTFIHRMTGFTSLSLPAAFALVATAGAAAAEPAARQLEGAYLHLDLGVAGAAAGAGTGEELDVALSGTAGSVGLELGWTLGPNLRVGLRAANYLVPGPELRIDDMVVQSDDDVEWGIAFAGVSARYSIMPSNFFVSGAVGAMIMTLDAPDVEAETDLGLGFELAIGKEWWVSERWGLGLTVNTAIGAIPDEADVDAAVEPEDWVALTLGLGLSATYY